MTAWERAAHRALDEMLDATGPEERNAISVELEAGVVPAGVLWRAAQILERSSVPRPNRKSETWLRRALNTLEEGN